MHRFPLLFTLKFIFSLKKQPFRYLCPFVCSERHASFKGILDTWGFIRQLGRSWKGFDSLGTASCEGSSQSARRRQKQTAFFTRVAVVFRSSLQFITATPWLQRFVSVRRLLERRREETKSRVKKGITQPQES